MQFKQAKAKIKAIKSNMEDESIKAEKESKDYQEKVLTLQSRAETTKKKCRGSSKRWVSPQKRQMNMWSCKQDS